MAAASQRGSSPLTRGKPVREIPGRRVLGLIPTHAGKTSCSSPSRPSTRAHPRSRGENLKCGCLAVAVFGSSPLTRGKTSPRNCGRGVGRFIPTDRGKLICIDEVHVTNWKAPNAQGQHLPLIRPQLAPITLDVPPQGTHTHSCPSQCHQAAAVCLAPTNSIN